MRSFDSLCVFCGSKDGNSPAYLEAARAFGGAVAARGLDLVYGGGRVGLMGAVADAARAGGSRVIGVIPEFLATKEVLHEAIDEQHVVSSMHDRKRLMAERAGAFVALPGGLGTLEELFEVTTWAQLGLHQKPIGLLDVGGFFSSLRTFLAHASREGFIAPEHAGLLVVESDPARLLDHLTEISRTASADGLQDRVGERS